MEEVGEPGAAGSCDLPSGTLPQQVLVQLLAALVPQEALPLPPPCCPPAPPAVTDVTALVTGVTPAVTNVTALVADETGVRAHGYACEKRLNTIPGECDFEWMEILNGVLQDPRKWQRCTMQVLGSPEGVCGCVRRLQINAPNPLCGRGVNECTVQVWLAMVGCCFA